MRETHNAEYRIIHRFSKSVFGSMNILYDKIKLLSQQHTHRISELDKASVKEEEDEEN